MVAVVARMGSGNETAMLLLPCSPVIVKVAALVVARAVKVGCLVIAVVSIPSRSLGGTVKVMDVGLMAAGDSVVKEMVNSLMLCCGLLLSSTESVMSWAGWLLSSWMGEGSSSITPLGLSVTVKMRVVGGLSASLVSLISKVA